MKTNAYARTVELLDEAARIGIMRPIALVKPMRIVPCVVYCSQCGGEFIRNNNTNGFSHCDHHSHLTNMDS